MYRVILILTFVWSNLFGQLKDFYGTWISENNELIFKPASNIRKEVSIMNKEGQEISFNENIIYNHNLYLINYVNSAIEDETYIFGYEKKGDSLLILKPGNRDSRNFFQTYLPIVFKKQELIIDTTLKFEKLILDKLKCRYETDCYSLMLSNNKQYKLNVNIEEFTQKYDTIKVINEIITQSNNYPIVKKSKKQFAGFLDESVYKELLFILTTSQLKTTKEQGEMVSDSPKYFLQIYQNKENYFYDYYNPPKNFQRLFSFLENLKEKILKN